MNFKIVIQFLLSFLIIFLIVIFYKTYFNKNDKNLNLSNQSNNDLNTEISKNNLENATKILQENSVHFDELGLVNEDGLIIDDKTKVSIDDLIKSHTNWLTNYMEN